MHVRCVINAIRTTHDPAVTIFMALFSEVLTRDTGYDVSLLLSEVVNRLSSGERTGITRRRACCGVAWNLRVRPDKSCLHKVISVVLS